MVGPMRKQGFVALGGVALMAGAYLAWPATWTIPAFLGGFWLAVAGVTGKAVLVRTVAVVAVLAALWGYFVDDWTVGVSLAVFGAFVAAAPQFVTENESRNARQSEQTQQP